ncbi:hypothetical protein [Streptomyces sp. NPDC093109]|uniref:hypothetical protein n=1 Tax=Streptomyces sp. NPDC093109 TaxID=3154977 RepID=UPI00344E0D72
MGGPGDPSGRGGPGGDGGGLARALGRLDDDSEPPMPDLVRASINQGYRIRHRRRVSTAIGSTVAVLVLAGGAMTLPSMISGLRPADGAANPLGPATVPGPTTMPGIRYPTTSVLRAADLDIALDVAEAKPGDPLVPGRYFRLAGPAAPDGFLLYAAVFPTVTTSRSAREALAAGTCVNLAGRLITTPWSDHAQCVGTATRWKDGDQMLSFTVTDQPAAAGTEAVPDSVADSVADSVPESEAGFAAGSAAESVADSVADSVAGHTAVGATYLTKDGWTIQVVAGALDRTSPASPSTAVPSPLSPASPVRSGLPQTEATPEGNGTRTGPEPAASGGEADLLGKLVIDLAGSERFLDLVLERTD